jgi:nitrate/nitrite transporter NarK
MLAGLYIGMPLGAYGLSYWLPTIVKSFGVSNTTNGLINIIPWICVAVALWLVPRHAARHGASAWHIAGPVLLGAIALSLSVIVPGAPLKFAMLCIAAPAIFAAQPVFWSLPPSFLSGPSAAAGIAAINAIGNLGGFIAQNLVPMVRDATGSNLAPMLALAAVLVVTSVLIFIAMARLKRSGATVG